MAFTTIRITGTYQQPDGSAASGQVTLLASAAMAQSGGDIREPIKVTGTLNSSGQIVDSSGTVGLAVPATDDPDTLPTGVTYTVTEYINGATPSSVSYTISVPHTSAGGVLDLSTVTRGNSPSNPSYNYVTVPVAAAYLRSVVSKTAAYTAADRDVVLANGTFTVTVPVGADQQVTVKNTGTGTVTVAPVSGTLDGVASLAISTQYQAITTVGDGTNAWAV